MAFLRGNPTPLCLQAAPDTRREREKERERERERETERDETERERASYLSTEFPPPPLPPLPPPTPSTPQPYLLHTLPTREFIRQLNLGELPPFLISLSTVSSLEFSGPAGDDGFLWIPLVLITPSQSRRIISSYHRYIGE